MHRTVTHRSLQTSFPAGYLVQEGVENLTLVKVPLDVLCVFVGFFKHVIELKCTDVRDSQQVCLCNLFLFTDAIYLTLFKSSIVSWRESVTLHTHIYSASNLLDSLSVEMSCNISVFEGPSEERYIL